MENNTQQAEMRLYELNKTLMANSKAFDLDEAREAIRSFFMEQYQLDRLNENYMLLAAEQRDFTVFRFKETNMDFVKMANEIVEILETRGVVKDVEIKDDHTVDIWVNDVFYKLFDYDWGVIEI